MNTCALGTGIHFLFRQRLDETKGIKTFVTVTRSELKKKDFFHFTHSLDNKSKLLLRSSLVGITFGFKPPLLLLGYFCVEYYFYSYDGSRKENNTKNNPKEP